MSYSDANIWWIIAVLGIGTFLIRFSFLGLIGTRPMPAWIQRHLRYTPVAVLPGLVAPLILWPKATGGETDPARLAAALVTIAIGYWFKGIVRAMVGGAVTLYLMQLVMT